jgi:hypothetical protein
MIAWNLLHLKTEIFNKRFSVKTKKATKNNCKQKGVREIILNNYSYKTDIIGEAWKTLTKNVGMRRASEWKNAEKNQSFWKNI